MHIRRANSRDLSAVADLYDIGRQTMYRQNNTFQWTKNYPLLEDAVADYENRGLFVVCKENKPEEILGCFSLLPGPDGRVPKSGVSKHFRCLKEVRLFPKI